MTEFSFDTSGVVTMRRDILTNGVPAEPDVMEWPDLSPFVQGCMLAAAEELAWKTDRVIRFRDWDPSALALILRDCEAFVRVHPGWDHHDGGVLFWRERQQGFEGFREGLDFMERAFPPLQPYLSDEGKVCLREAQ